MRPLSKLLSIYFLEVSFWDCDALHLFGTMGGTSKLSFPTGSPMSCLPGSASSIQRLRGLLCQLLVLMNASYTGPQALTVWQESYCQ